MAKNQADEETDKILEKLEKKIKGVYSEAAKESLKTTNAYFQDFKERDEKMLQQLNAGDIDESYYKQWRLNQIGRGKRYEAMSNQLATQLYNSNTLARSYVNDSLAGVYAVNHNWGAYEIESLAGANVGFTLYDESTVKRLIVESPETMPHYSEVKALKRGIDVKYGKKQISAAVTSGILQGKSIKDLASDITKRVVGMNQESSLRAARTATTSAQNGGRQDSYERAEAMGIDLEKEWMATLDERTRTEHQELDGQRVATDKPFEVAGYKIKYPGDSSAPACMVYNCRCTMVASLKGFENISQRTTYSEWLQAKQEAEGTEQTTKSTSASVKSAVKKAVKTAEVVKAVKDVTADYKVTYEPYQRGQITRTDAGQLYKAVKNGDVVAKKELVNQLYNETEAYIKYANERYTQNYIYYDRVTELTRALLNQDYKTAQEKINQIEALEIKRATKKSKWYKYKAED